MKFHTSRLNDTWIYFSSNYSPPTAVIFKTLVLEISLFLSPERTFPQVTIDPYKNRECLGRVMEISRLTP